MDITERHIGAVTVVELGGDTDLYNTGELKNHLSGLVDSGHYRIVLNVHRVLHMDSTAIGILVHILNTLKPHQGVLALASVPAPLQKVLELTKVISFFKIYSTEEEAVAAVKAA